MYMYNTHMPCYICQTMIIYIYYVPYVCIINTH